MGKLLKIACLVLLPTLLASCVALDTQSRAERSCRAFLRHVPEIHLASTGTQTAFTGRFTPIPAPLSQDLQQQFPNNTFVIANMTYTHWGPDPVSLLLVLDRADNRVCSFLWAPWFEEPPFSFRSMFSQNGQSKDIAKARIAALSRLIAFQVGGKTGEVSETDGVVFASISIPDTSNRWIIRSRVTPKSSSEWFAIVPDKTSEQK